jgi:membrane fusion protein (multidrug efflux system)
LFIGTSVVPTIYINRPPTGPDAGKYLQTDAPPSSRPSPAAGASSTRP